MVDNFCTPLPPEPTMEPSWLQGKAVLENPPLPWHVLMLGCFTPAMIMLSSGLNPNQWFTAFTVQPN
jgi:hypothetical protein